MARGETLGLIAERAFGAVTDWRRLYNENRNAVGGDPWILEVGTVLSVPCGTPGAEREATTAEVGGSALAIDPFDRPPQRPLPSPSWQAIEGEESVALGPDVLALIPPAIAARLIERGDALQVIDLGPADSWEAGVVAGAACIETGAWRSAARQGGAIGIGTLIGRAGLRPDHPILLVHRGGEGLGDAALVQWLLHDAGLRAVALLDGGDGAWRAEGRQTMRCMGRIDADDMPAPPISGTAAAEPPLPPATALHVVVDEAGSCAEADAASGTGAQALDAALRLMTLDLPWSEAAITLFAEDDRHAALAWFALHEIAGIPGLRVTPAAAWRGRDVFEDAARPNASAPASEGACSAGLGFTALRGGAVVDVANGNAAPVIEGRDDLPDTMPGAAPSTLIAGGTAGPTVAGDTEGAALGIWRPASGAVPGTLRAPAAGDAPAPDTDADQRPQVPVIASPAPAQPDDAIAGGPFLQAGVFTALSAGRRLVEQLTSEGLPAEALQIRFRGSAAIRVRLGPFDTLEARRAADRRLRVLGIRDAFPVAS
ncbi:MAG: rhodanese-like domain-containing protein [Pseudomonadota bacterium]